MTEMKLRGYQTDAIHAVFKAWADGMCRPAVVLPTGAGKTVVFAHLIKRFRDWCALPPRPGFSAPGSRVIVLVHRDELADQAIAKIRSVAPGLNVGKVKAESNEVDADVVVASVQTLAVERRRLMLYESMGNDDQKPFGLIITDECHHAAATSYQKIYAAFPDALQLGVTATMARGDGVGLGDVWEEVVYSRSPLWMMSKGYLTGVRALSVSVEGLDMGSVKSSRGDYQAGDLGNALADSHADSVIARAYKEHAADRPGVVFTPTVSTAELTASAMNDAGITTAVVSGETPRDERQQIFDDFRTGRVQVLANCMVLTEGFDAPWASCAVIARPTQSQPLYVQMVGRVLRPYPGKKDALVLDVVGAGAANKLRTLIDLEPGTVRSLKEGELLEEAVIREAEEGGQSAPQGSVAFGLKHKDLDLFAGSEFAWLRTHKGVLFISCGGSNVFLWPSRESPGHWDVGIVPKGQKAQRTPYTGLDIGSAMAWGEAVADDYRSFQVTRSARWRKSRASDAQVGLASSLGIGGADQMQRGDLSDAISVAVFSRQFDRYVS